MTIDDLLLKPTPAERIILAAESIPTGEVLTTRELAAKMKLSHDRFKKIAVDPRLDKNRYTASQGVSAYWGSRKTIQTLKKRMK